MVSPSQSGESQGWTKSKQHSSPPPSSSSDVEVEVEVEATGQPRGRGGVEEEEEDVPEDESPWGRSQQMTWIVCILDKKEAEGGEGGGREDDEVSSLAFGLSSRWRLPKSIVRSRDQSRSYSLDSLNSALLNGERAQSKRSNWPLRRERERDATFAVSLREFRPLSPEALPSSGNSSFPTRKIREALSYIIEGSQVSEELAKELQKLPTSF